MNVGKIVSPEEHADKDKLVESLENRLLQTTLKDEQQKALSDFLGTKTKLDDADIRTAIRLVMATPEYQVT